MAHRTGCLICGAELRYRTERTDAVCSLCGASRPSDASCAAGHFVCDPCHGASALDVIEQVCIRSPQPDPIALASELMRSPLVHMHGPEHHFLVPAVLISAACNVRGTDDKRRLVGEARQRAEAVPGGACGFWGACGAGIGTGIAVSVLCRATPLSTSEWRLANRMTARALELIAAHGGPRCCKRDSFLALREAARFLDDELGIRLPTADAVACEHSDSNRECLRGECPFFR